MHIDHTAGRKPVKKEKPARFSFLGTRLEVKSLSKMEMTPYSII
jgi:hypothetical protein